MVLLAMVSSSMLMMALLAMVLLASTFSGSPSKFYLLMAPHLSRSIALSSEIMAGEFLS